MGGMYPAQDGCTVARFLRTNNVSSFILHPQDNVVDAATSFTGTANGRKHSLAVVVNEDGQVAGVLSLGDIALALSRHKAAVVTMTVDQIMTRDVCAAKADDELSALMELMAEKKIRHMPVVENGVLLGVITRKDVLEGLYENASLELKSVTEFVFRSGARY